jgi:hypothetical protein
MEPATDASASPPTSERQEVPLPQLAEAAETAAAVAATSAAEVVVGEAGSSPSLPVAAEVDEVRVPDKPAAIVQERVAPDGTTKTTSPEIKEAEETGASCSQGTAGGEAQALELACTSWAAASGSGGVSEDDEEVAACNTLERGPSWCRPRPRSLWWRERLSRLLSMLSTRRRASMVFRASRLGPSRLLTADAAASTPSPRPRCWEGGRFGSWEDGAPARPRSERWREAEC